MANSLAAEQAVLGALMLDSTAYARVTGKVGASDFTDARHRIIWQAIEDLQGHRMDADTVTVMERLRGRVDSAYVGTLARETPSADNVESYAAIVRSAALKRTLAIIGERTIKAAGESGIRAAELIADLQQQLHGLQSAAVNGAGLVDAQELARDLAEDLQRRLDGPTGLQFGICDLDSLVGGLEPGHLTVIGARPAMGKSALMVNIAAKVGAKTGVAIFSAEMSSIDLMRRAVALQASVTQSKLQQPASMSDADWAAVDSACGAVGRTALAIDDRSAPSVAYIRVQAIARKARGGPLGLIMVDYLQLMKGGGKTRYEELRAVAYDLKGLAKELRTPVVALAQLNREVEKRDGGRPTTADLRDCGAIEEAADHVLLLHSEAHHRSDFGMPYVLEIIVDKNRHGPRGACYAHYDRQTGRISSLDDGAKAQYRRLLQGPQRGGGEL